MTITCISVGSLVGLKRTSLSLGVAERLSHWIAAYGRGPFKVFYMLDSEHVSLKDENDREIHFGSTIDTSLHISYVEPWEE